MSNSGPVRGSIVSGRGVVIVNTQNVIEDIDSAACTLLGYSKQEIIGMHGSELVPLDAHPATAVSLDRMRRGELTHRPGRLRHRNGAVVHVQVAGRVLPDGRLLLALRPQLLG
jgi:PAS domain S-box-containing protein